MGGHVNEFETNRLRQRGVYDVMTSTLQGHDAPAAVRAAEAGETCILRTDGCEYVLDDEGICRQVTGGNERCVGAQYVASLDPDADGFLSAEPKPGTYALFVGRGTGLRMALLKTAQLISVEWQDVAGEPQRPVEPRNFKSTLLKWQIGTEPGTPLLIPSVPVPKFG